MRIGFLTSVPITVEAFFLDWMKEWGALGWDVHVAAGGDRPDGLVCASYTNIEALGQNPSLGSVRAVQQLKRWRDDRSLDLVVTNTATVSALYRLLPRGQVPTVYFCHGLHFGDAIDGPVDRAFHVVESALVKRTDAAICMNSRDHDFFNDKIGAERVLMLDAGVGLNTETWDVTSRRSSMSEPGSTARKLLWMGMFAPRKRPLDAIRVLDRLGRLPGSSSDVALGEVTLEMLGTGPLLEEAKALALTLGLEDRVTFPGHVDPRERMASSDALVHTASWEGYCRTLMEASYIELPAVAYDVKGCRDVSGVITVGQPGDVNTLALAVRDVLHGRVADDQRPDFSWQAAFESVTSFLLLRA